MPEATASDTAHTDADPDAASDELPAVLRYVEPILADPADVRREALAVLAKFEEKYGAGGDAGDDEADRAARLKAQRAAADKVVSNYSYYTAMSGGATALAGVVPGLGTVVAAVGGATADVVVTMKFEVEMVMALATVYGHDVTETEMRRLCLLIAGLGTVTSAATEGAKVVGEKAFVRLVREHLRAGTLVAVKQAFKKVGLTFTRKGLEKAAPFGIGVVLGFSANKTLTYYVGRKARAFFESPE